MRKLFVVGCGRSGTTMLQQALNRHPQIVIPPETGFFLDFLGHTRRGQCQHVRRINTDLQIELPLPHRRIAGPEQARAFYERLAQVYLERLGRTDVVYFGEKSPRHLLVIRRIAELFPDARFLLIYRDGRDVALSLSKVPWGPSDYDVNFAIWLRFYRRQRWARAAGLNLRCIRYEALVADPESELRRVAEFLDVPFVRAMSEGSGNREGVPEWEDGWKARALQNIDTSRVAVWRRELSPRHVELIERWGGEELADLGYSLVTDRAKRLPWWFLPRVYWKQFAWWVGCAWRLAKKELLGE